MVPAAALLFLVVLSTRSLYHTWAADLVEEPASNYSLEAFVVCRDWRTLSLMFDSEFLARVSSFASPGHALADDLEERATFDESSSTTFSEGTLELATFLRPMSQAYCNTFWIK